jgi:hypothetical protein
MDIARASWQEDDPRRCASISALLSASAIVPPSGKAVMYDIYANDPTPPISEKQQRELADTQDTTRIWRVK